LNSALVQNHQKSVHMINEACDFTLEDAPSPHILVLEEPVRLHEACGCTLEDAPTLHSLSFEGLLRAYTAEQKNNSTDQESVQSEHQTLDTDSNAIKDFGDRCALVAQVRYDKAPPAGQEIKMISSQQVASKKQKKSPRDGNEPANLTQSPPITRSRSNAPDNFTRSSPMTRWREPRQRNKDVQDVKGRGEANTRPGKGKQINGIVATHNQPLTRSQMFVGDTIITDVHKVPRLLSHGIPVSSNDTLDIEIAVPESSTEWSYNPVEKTYQERERRHGAGQRHKLVLPALVIKKSRIPQAGRGVFSKDRIAKGTTLSEYGGRAIFAKEAMRLMAQKEDTHLKGAGRKVVGCAQLDGRITEQLDLEYYSSHHQVGSLFNGGKKVRFNAKYVIEDTGKGYHHPHASSVSGFCHPSRVFVVSTKNVEPNEEYYVDYGTSFNSRNIH